MIIESVKFRGHRCFQNDWSGFDAIKPINVIIGRNNTGKSHLLDLVESLCGDFRAKGKEYNWEYVFKGMPDKVALQREFAATMTIRSHQWGAYTNRWDACGRYLLGREMTWQTDKNGDIPKNPDFEGISGEMDGVPFAGMDPEGYASLRRMGSEGIHKLKSKKFRRLSAERDIQPQTASNNLSLQSNGDGATNIIRRCIHSTDPNLSRDLIQKKLLEALNIVFAGDGKFTEIQAKHHDTTRVGNQDNSWEIFLGEENKGLIALSRSGSGLKTIILVLLNLLVLPEIEKASKENFVFAFEELENNLHPALLRRVFQYLEEYANKYQATIFLTTHSSVALDLFGTSPNAQVIHVTHDGKSAKTETISAHFEQLDVISKLGAKPSDLLQANGIVWVEGPSDRIYMNRLIEIFSDGKWKEGRNYQCAFYGGALLARTQFTQPPDSKSELANLLRVNPNVIVVCDGDRTESSAPFKERTQRVQAEVSKVPNAHIWITEAKEIENYLPGSIYNQLFGQGNLPDPKQFEVMFPRETGISYIEEKLQRKTFDKNEIAIQATPLMTKELMCSRFDLTEQMKKIVDRIAKWNS